MKKTIIESLRFIGTGPSSSVPNLACLATERCGNCLNEINHRTCVSLLIRTNAQPILIDCGKDFIRQYTSFLNIKHENEEFIPTVLITHAHADAILGLDSLMQMAPTGKALNLYSDEVTIKHLVDKYKYLFNHLKENTGYFVSNELRINEVNDINGINVVPYHVEHGYGNALAFYIDDTVLYVSDCSLFDLDINPKVLIIDCTSIYEKIYGHLTLAEVVEVVRKTNPVITYLVGMSHEIDYVDLQDKVTAFNLNILIAFDDMELEYDKLVNCELSE